MARQLVAQAETRNPSSTGHYFGYEVFETEGRFAVVIHTSTYDGIKRASHWACPEQPLEAQCKEDAMQEAAKAVAAYANAVLGLRV